MTIVAAVLCVAYYDGISELVDRWSKQEEYSHGYLIPFVSLFFIWQKSQELSKINSVGTWTGTVLVVLGVSILLLGEITALFLFVQYSMIIVLVGLTLAFFGISGTRIILIPILLLIFVIPLPYFIDSDLSGGLQLLSSKLGVAVIRIFGIPVYLEGNVIDLGVYKLQVVEACSGLRYLYPLMSFGFICAYIWRTSFWKKMLLFLSTIPIAILMNSFRIGVIGVLVENAGIEQAEGFLHDFEGWVIFMSCVAILFAEMYLLGRISDSNHRDLNILNLDFPTKLPKSENTRVRKTPKPFVASSVILLVAAIAVAVVSNRVEAIPGRKTLTTFPTSIQTWHGGHGSLNDNYVEVLKFSDYLLADFHRGNETVNLYVAYYENQRKGNSPHSPRVCIPGGGWQITDLQRKSLELQKEANSHLLYNRVIIKRGDDIQLVYYWFQQRGRIMANEYLVKWYLFWDALIKNRTDGALVRLVTQLDQGEPIEAADRRLGEFAKVVTERLDPYIPI